MAAFGLATYTSDTGLMYNKRMSLAHFTPSGLATGDGSQSAYPHRWYARRVHGVDSTKLKHCSLIVDDTSDLWTGTTNTFSVSGTAFTVTGRTGEKRPNGASPF